MTYYIEYAIYKILNCVRFIVGIWYMMPLCLFPFVIFIPLAYFNVILILSWLNVERSETFSQLKFHQPCVRARAFPHQFRNSPKHNELDSAPTAPKWQKGGA